MHLFVSALGSIVVTNLQGEIAPKRLRRIHLRPGQEDGDANEQLLVQARLDADRCPAGSVHDARSKTRPFG